MSLSKPTVNRELIHERKITCHGYRREDGLWDIEGHLSDTKTYGFTNMDRGTVAAGEPVHSMWLRLTVDDELVIHETEAFTEYSPFDICPGGAVNFSKIRGVKIGPGFRREVAGLVGASLGCTHMRELLGRMATTAFQTIYPIKAREIEGSTTKHTHLLGTCHAYAPGSEVVRRLWPETKEA